MDGEDFVEGGLKSPKAIAIWVPISIAGAFFLVAIIGVFYLVITGKCSYCKRRRYNKKVEQYKKAAAAGIPPSLKGSASNHSNSEKKKKNKKNALHQNGVIANGGPGHAATLPRNGNEVWQTQLPLMTSQGIMTQQGLVQSQTPPPYYVYAAPNYMTTLPNDGTSKYVVQGQNGHAKQGSKTLPRPKPAKLTTENLMKYQQESGGVILGKGQTIVCPPQAAHGPHGVMNGMAHHPQMNGFATLPNMGANRKANGYAGQPQIINGQMLANGHITENGHVKMNGHVPRAKSATPPEVYPGEIYPQGVMQDTLSVNGSLYPIKYVDDNGQTYIFVDDPQMLAATQVDDINNDGMAVMSSNGYNSQQLQPVSSGPEGVARVDTKVVNRAAETAGTSSIQQKPATTMEAKKYSSPHAVAVSNPHLQEITSFKGDPINNSPKSSNGFTATASSQQIASTASIKDINASATMMAYSPEDQANLVDFGTLTKQDGNREVKEVAVFMRWSPQLDKREFPIDGSMQYVATAHSSGSGSSGEVAAMMPQIVVTSEGDVMVPRNNMR